MWSTTSPHSICLVMKSIASMDGKASALSWYSSCACLWRSYGCFLKHVIGLHSTVFQTCRLVSSFEKGPRDTYVWHILSRSTPHLSQASRAAPRIQSFKESHVGYRLELVFTPKYIPERTRVEIKNSSDITGLHLVVTAIVSI